MNSSKLDQTLFSDRDDNVAVTLHASTTGVVASMTINWRVDHFSFRSHSTAPMYSPSIRQQYLGMDDSPDGEWGLVMTPKVLSKRDTEEKEREFVSLHLRRETSKGTEIPTRFSLRILDENGGCMYRRDCMKPVIFALKNQGSAMWGWDRYISHDELFDIKKKFLVNDSLLLQADVQCLVASNSVDELVPSSAPASSSCKGNCLLSVDYGQLYLDKNATDFKLVSKEGTFFPVHSGILIGRSDYFRAMLSHDTKEKRERVCVFDDLDGVTLDILLVFLYSGNYTLDRLKSVAETLLVAADKYCIKGLKTVCEQVLLDAITVANAGRLLVLADMHNAAELKQRVKQFLTPNLHAFIASGGLEEVTNHSPDLMSEVLMYANSKRAMDSGKKSSGRK